MEIRHLEYILAIAETGNMTRAAQKLFVSQPTLSQFLTKQESELGTPLFQRSNGSYSLTPAGCLYADYAKKVITLTEDLNKNIERISTTSRIRIGTSASRSLQMLTSILGDFRTYYPKVELIMSDDNLRFMSGYIQHGEVDMAFITANTLEQFKGQSLELKREEVVFAAPNSQPYCQKQDPAKLHVLTSGLLIEEFGNYPFILQHTGACIRYLIDSFFEKRDFKPVIACTTNHAQSICDMVASGIGVGFIPSGYAVASPRITYFSLEPKLFRIHAILYRKDLILEPPHKYLIELARNYAAANWQSI